MVLLVAEAILKGQEQQSRSVSDCELPQLNRSSSCLTNESSKLLGEKY